MVLAILEDFESSNVINTLHKAGYPLTLIDSTGGLLRRGNSTIIAGVNDSRAIKTKLVTARKMILPKVHPLQSDRHMLTINLLKKELRLH